jgi:hypothetical protein
VSTWNTPPPLDRAHLPVHAAELCAAVCQQCWVPEQVCWWRGEAVRGHKAPLDLNQQVEAGVQPSPAGSTCNSTAQGTAQHSTAQHSTAQHSTAQHSTAQHSTAQHQHEMWWNHYAQEGHTMQLHTFAHVKLRGQIVVCMPCRWEERLSALL